MVYRMEFISSREGICELEDLIMVRSTMFDVIHDVKEDVKRGIQIKDYKVNAYENPLDGNIWVDEGYPQIFKAITCGETKIPCRINQITRDFAKHLLTIDDIDRYEFIKDDQYGSQWALFMDDNELDYFQKKIC